MFILITLLSSLSTAAILSDTECDPAKDISDLIMTYIDNPITFNAEQLDKITASFDYYDTDKNGKWSVDEFVRFQSCTLDFSILFDKMNFPGDDILSFRELVSYLMHLNQNIANLLYEVTKEAIINEYGFEENVDSAQLFNEYLADSILIKFDETAEAFMKRDIFVDDMNNEYFKIYDLDNDENIDFEEFEGIQFNEDSLIKMRDLLLELADIDIDNTPYNKYDAFSLELETCPSVYSNPLIIDSQQISSRKLLNRVLEIFEDIGCGLGILATVGGCATVTAATVGTGLAPCVGGAVATLSGCGALIGARAERSCFGAETNSVLIKRDGDVHEMLLSELQIGDYIQSRDNSDNIIWSKVWFINEHYGEYEMIRLQYIDDNNFIGNLTLTGDHLLYANDFVLTRADSVFIGDNIKIVNNGFESDEFMDVNVIDISYVYDYARSPITINGDIIISSVLASSYTKSKSNAERLHKSGKIFRQISENIDTKLAVFIVNFWYNYVFKTLKCLSMDKLGEYYLFVPVVSGLFLVLMYHSFIYFYQATKSKMKLL